MTTLHGSLASTPQLKLQTEIPDYSAKYDPAANKANFKQAKRYYEGLERLADPDTVDSDRLSLFIANELAYVIFGSNQIEHVRCGLVETMAICYAVFISDWRQHSLAGLVPHSVGYVKCLADIIHNYGDIRDAQHVNERREVANHAAAFLHIFEACIDLEKPITEDLINATHSILVHDIPAGPVPSSVYGGKYRTVPVSAGATNFVVPHKIPAVM